MKRTLLIAALAVALPAAAQVTMPPNKQPVPSPSDLRGATGEDRPQGQGQRGDQQCAFHRHLQMKRAGTRPLSLTRR